MRGVQYHDATANPKIDSLTFVDAQATLKTFLGGLPNPPAPSAPKALAHAHRPTSSVHLALDEIDSRKSQRPKLTYRGHQTGWSPAAKTAVKAPLPLKPIDLDPVTVRDDERFAEILESETNLPKWLKLGLKRML